jgi:hypothetical protein
MHRAFHFDGRGDVRAEKNRNGLRSRAEFKRPYVAVRVPEEAALVSGDTLGRAFGLISRIDCHAAGEQGMGLY